MTIELKEALGRLIERRDLTADEMAGVVGRIMDGEATPAQVGALLTALRMKGETVDEVVGAARAMRARMLKPQVEGLVCVDLCGTGGDGSGSVNVSTLASFIVAACGVPVAKHGNRAMSSKSGSHDVIEALGIDPAPGPELATRCLRETHLCFLFAPAYHAATKHAVGPRREIGFRTFFNLLGPLTNPAEARHHVNGVFAVERCEFLARAHGQLGSTRALVVHGAGGLDELAPRGATQVAELKDGAVKRYEVQPADFGLEEADPAGLRGGEPAVNARLVTETLQGVAGAIRTASLMTAGAALYVTGNAPDLKSGTARAKEALDGGKALGVLEALRRIAPVAVKTA
ncbi:MAG TPA: anthranilate phosphoribosyltransferase [Polyangia bacterium]|nr:anthranilate phosphoribosyltransferase [Polyangia bacterium]